ncbi:PqqD family protein [Aromatoleum sp.]|uniref:PqqD family protein n=1 Tax=Aromatoleum sp. TaxID=2307007 RepID=UPI0039C85744
MECLTKNGEYASTVLPDGSCILFNSSTGKTVVLTAPAAIFWELCDGKTVTLELLRELREYYPLQSDDTIQADALALCQQLISLGVMKAANDV